MDVDLNQLARTTGRSATTIRAMIWKRPDFPILERGRRGVAYRFDLDAAVAFMAAIDARPAPTITQREAMIRQLGLSIPAAPAAQVTA